MADVIDQEPSIQKQRQALLDESGVHWEKDHEQRLRRLENLVHKLCEFWPELKGE
jgi:hypothetical protein